MSSAETDEPDFDLDDFDLDDYNNINSKHINNQTIHVVANDYLEEINKMNEINNTVRKQMKNSNNDRELNMHKNIIEENDRKIKEYTETYNKIREIYNNIINENNTKIKHITDIYHDINLSHEKKIYYIGHIVNGSHVINTTSRYINESAKVTTAKSHKPKVGTKNTKKGGKKSKKIIKSKKSKSKKSKSKKSKSKKSKSKKSKSKKIMKSKKSKSQKNIKSK
jgi:hypothetical protein